MNDAFELIKTFPYSTEAFICKGRLEAEGIAVYIKDNNMIDANPLYSQAIGGVKLFVSNADAEKARQILASISDFSTDEKGKPLTCPQCGANQVEMMTSLKGNSFWLFLPALLFAVFPFVKYRYRCRNCNFEFKA